MKNTSLLSSYQAISVTAIQPSPYQARKTFDEESLQGLAASMKQEGLIEPIVVRPASKNRFELISGERRLRAAKLLGWTTIEAKIITTQSEGEAAVKGLIENIQRMDLNAMEEAEAFQGIQQMDKTYWTQNKVADVSGKSRTYVNKSLALLQLSEDVKEGVRRRTLSRDHGIELLRIINRNQQKALAKKVVEGGWSVKETRRQIELVLKGKIPARPGKGLSTDLPPTDPLEKVWDRLHAQENFVPDAGWGVTYKEHGDPSEPMSQEWIFSVRPITRHSEKALVFWFEQMAVALKGGKTKAAKSETLAEFEKMGATLKKLTPFVGKMRPPRNEQEYIQWLRQSSGSKI